MHEREAVPLENASNRVWEVIETLPNDLYSVIALTSANTYRQIALGLRISEDEAKMRARKAKQIVAEKLVPSESLRSMISDEIGANIIKAVAVKMGPEVPKEVPKPNGLFWLDPSVLQPMRSPAFSLVSLCFAMLFAMLFAETRASNSQLETEKSQLETEKSQLVTSLETTRNFNSQLGTENLKLVEENSQLAEKLETTHIEGSQSLNEKPQPDLVVAKPGGGTNVGEFHVQDEIFVNDLGEQTDLAAFGGGGSRWFGLAPNGDKVFISIEARKAAEIATKAGAGEAVGPGGYAGGDLCINNVDRLNG